MNRKGMPLAVLLLSLMGAAYASLSAQRSMAQSPDTWPQLSLPEFVRVIDQLTTGGDPVSEELWAEIRRESAERVIDITTRGVAADYRDLVSLYLWASPVLTPAQRTALAGNLNPNATEVGAWSFEKLKDTHVRMESAGLTESQLAALPLGWLTGRDLRTLEDVDQLGWLHQQVKSIGRTEPAPRSFTVLWTGSIEAPSAGAYTFSAAGLDLNYRQGRHYRSQTMAVWVGGQKVLDTAEGTEGTPVSLPANAKRPLRIDFSYAASSDAFFTGLPAVAQLFWKGPALGQQTVPESALSTPDGVQSGLLGQYVLLDPNGPVSKNRVDAQVNFIWYHGSQVFPQENALLTGLAQQLQSVANRSSTLATWENEKEAADDEWVGANSAFLESLSPQQQANWADTLLAHPVLLADCSRTAAMDLYRVCRVGAPSSALQLFGTWAQSHADEPLAVGVDFFQVNRRPYYNLACKMTHCDSNDMEQLEEQYLVLPDGSCSLPAAYTLSYGYWLNGQIADWIDMLETQLSNSQVEGDRRVNWLLARAQAEEVRRSGAGGSSRPAEHVLAGLAFLQEACLVAETEPVKLRAHKEMALRYTSNENLVAARAVLDQAQQRCTTAQSTQLLALWRGELDVLRQSLEARHQDREAAARDAYVKHLQSRHQKSVNRGDSAAASRYEQLLAGAGASGE